MGLPSVKPLTCWQPVGPRAVETTQLILAVHIPHSSQICNNLSRTCLILAWLCPSSTVAHFSLSIPSLVFQSSKDRLENTALLLFRAGKTLQTFFVWSYEDSSAKHKHWRIADSQHRVRGTHSAVYLLNAASQHL